MLMKLREQLLCSVCFPGETCLLFSFFIPQHQVKCLDRGNLVSVYLQGFPGHNWLFSLCTLMVLLPIKRGKSLENHHYILL